MMRGTIGQIGQNVTTKEGKFGTCKIIPQFSKCNDPDLPFIIIHRLILNTMKVPIQTLTDHQLNNQRKKIPRREQLVAFGSSCVTMPVRRTLAVRSKFHNIPLELAPPPNDPVAFHEHSYAQSINKLLC